MARATLPDDAESSPEVSVEAPESNALLDLALLLAENLRLLVLVPLAAGLVALGISFFVPQTFTARAVVMPPQQQQSSVSMALQSLGAIAGIAGGAGGLRSPSDQYVALIQSTNVADRIIDQFKLIEVYDVKYRADARKELAQNTRVGAGKKDNLITVEVDDEDPKRAADMANAYIDHLKRLTTELAITEAQQRRAFFERQLQQTKDRLTQAQRAMQSSGINEGTVRAEPKAAAEGYAKLRAEVTAEEVRVQAMRGSMLEEAPELRLANARLSALRTQLARTEGLNSAAGQGDYIEKFREFKYQETLYELFVKQFEMAKLDESREGAVIQVLDKAGVPERKSKPKRVIVALSTTLSVLLLLLLWLWVRGRWHAAQQSLETGPKLRSLTRALRQNLSMGSRPRS